MSKVLDSRIFKNYLKSFKEWVRGMKEGARISMEEFSIEKPEDGHEVSKKKVIITADGILPELIKKSPFFAGWSSVVVVHSDMVASGGMPLELFVSISAENKRRLKTLLSGIKSASSLLGIKISGGHTILGRTSSLSTFLIGEKIGGFKKIKSKNLIMGLLFDRKGRKGTRFFPSWNSFFKSSSEEIKRKRRCVLEVTKFSSLVKDISTGGILGTCAIALEALGLGGEIDIARISPPDGISLEYWLKAFQSFGFLIFTKEEFVDMIKEKCEKNSLRFDVIGRTLKEKKFYIVCGSKRIKFFDLSRERILRWK